MVESYCWHEGWKGTHSISYTFIAKWRIYEGESVNRSQMDIKHKTYDIRNWKKTFISRHSLHQHGYTCPISLPVRRNPQRRSLLTVVAATSAPAFQHLYHKREVFLVSRPSCEPTWETLPTVNRKYFVRNILCIESFCPQKMHNRTLLFCDILKHGRHFDYWNQPLNMRISICYLDYHETGLCCYLVMHIENLLRPLQLFYLNLCPI
jgi:hypothetical protein